MFSTYTTTIIKLSALLILATTLQAEEKVYNLTVTEKTVNFTGTPRTGISINNSIPSPTTNNMDKPTSLHWHGLLVPPLQDGVPYISFLPIKPLSTHTYRFPIRQAGTYWYHSHTGLQEQQGLYGAIIIEPRHRHEQSSLEQVVMLSDWTDSAPGDVMRLLRRGSEAMGVRKKTSQSLLGAWKTRKVAQFWQREAMRMPPMDLADVAYDAFLINGQQKSNLHAKPGDTVKLRIINGGTSSNFYLQYAGGPMTIISADGQNVQPLPIETPLFIAVAETYDVLVKIPARGGSYEFRSTAQDGSGHASLWIGSGDKHAATPMPQPFVYDTMRMFDWKNLFALTPASTLGIPDSKVRMGMYDQPGFNMKMTDMNMGSMEPMRDMGNAPSQEVYHNSPKWYDFLLREDSARPSRLVKGSQRSTLRPFPPYKKLRSTHKTNFPNKEPIREVRLTLDGDMQRYIWMFNNQILKPENDIIITEGEIVRFIFINRTMMHHPLHLHGHFFRIINGQGDYSPLKHTVNVAPMETTVIEFEANEKGDWFFHCHLLYHIKAGMGRVIRYENYVSSPEVEANRDQIYHDPWYLFGYADALSNLTQGSLRLENSANIFSVEWDIGWQNVPDIEWETLLTYDRYLNRFTSIFAGVHMDGIGSSRDSERAIAGIRYLLPLNIASSAWIGSDGESRITMGRELMLTPRLSVFGNMEFDTRDQWSTQAGISYMINANVSATTLWDSDYGVGAGFTLSF